MEHTLNATESVFTIPKLPGGKIEILRPDSKGLNEVMQVLAKAFLEREPMAHEMYKKNPAEASRDMDLIVEGMTQEMAATGLSNIVRNAQGEVVALLLAEPFVGEPITLPDSLGPVGDVLNELHRQCNTFLRERDHHTKVVQLAIIANRDDYQGYGFGTLQTKFFFEQARRLGFTDVVTDATSVSQVLFARLGLKSIGEVAYQSIPEFEKIPEFTRGSAHPITHALLMWGKLDELP